MKNLKLTGMALSFLICCAAANAQDKSPLNEPDQNRPTLFSNFPDKISVDANELKSLVAGNAVMGRDASVRFGNEKLSNFRGRVVSTTSREDNSLKSVVLRSEEFNGASFTVSAIRNADGSTSYAGRIISFRHADMYVLEQTNGAYFLVKKNFYEVVSE